MVVVNNFYNKQFVKNYVTFQDNKSWNFQAKVMGKSLITLSHICKLFFFYIYTFSSKILYNDYFLTFQNMCYFWIFINSLLSN